MPAAAKCASHAKSEFYLATPKELFSCGAKRNNLALNEVQNLAKKVASKSHTDFTIYDGVRIMKAIPKNKQPGVFGDISFLHSEFVELTEKEGFDVRMKYAEFGMENAVHNCFVRKEVYERLCYVQQSLPEGVKLRIWDAWRPLALQEELYSKYSKRIIRENNIGHMPEKERNEIISRFISVPDYDVKSPPVHTTGGAVDVTLTDENGNELDMGSKFDEFSEKAETFFYEETKNTVIRDNRRILYNSMINAGFTNLPSEWWHYDFGTKFWAYYKKQPALFEGVFDIKGVYLNEK